MWELAISCLLFGDVHEVDLESATEVACREVDDLARQYRIQVYNTFRTQRDVYDQWAAKGFEVLEFSRLLPVQSSQQHQLAQWFQSAAVATQSGQAIPETPPVDLSQIAVQSERHSDLNSDLNSESTDSPSTNDRQATHSDNEQVTHVEQETVTHAVSSTDSNESHSSLPWGAVGRALFNTDDHFPAEDAEATNASDSKVTEDTEATNASDSSASD